MPFRFSFDSEAGSTNSGWAPVTITLGDYVEESFAQIAEWIEQDYVAHWEAARLSCVRGEQFVVFCSSRSSSTDDLTTLWIGRRTENGYRFFNCAAPHGDVQVSGKLASLSDYGAFGPDKDVGVSTWDVALADIAERKP